MSDVTRILSQIETGDPSAADQLLPLVYDELGKLAASRLTHETPHEALDATTLVHEAYIRLVDVEATRHWDSRGHFFAAAAESMRRILVEEARRRSRLKRGGHLHRHNIDDIPLATAAKSDEVLAVSEALDRLEATHAVAAQLVTLRYFAGLTGRESAALIGVSPRKADQIWAYARSWLLAELTDEEDED